MSKVKALYHIVFCTKRREMTLTSVNLEDIYRFIWKDVDGMKCRLIRIGGIQNHIHLLVDLHPSVALSDFVKEIKSHSSIWLRRDPRFPLFDGWGKEYFATTIGERDVRPVIEYISTQPQHHLGHDFDMELSDLYESSGYQYDNRDLR